ncbi:MAG: GumC family protein [Thermodesulfobacteriota bacterium]
MQAQGPQYFPAPHVTAANSSLRDILIVLFRRKKEFLLFSGAIFLSVLFFTHLSPEIYQSEAKVLIRVGRESLSLDPTIDGPTIPLSQSRESEVNSELAIIKSRLLAEQVVDSITPAAFLAGGEPESDSDASPNFLRTAVAIVKKALKSGGYISGKDEDQLFDPLREKAIAKMINNLKVAAGQKSNVIIVSFEAPTPQFGREVLNTFLTLYQDHHIQVHSAHAPPQFFQDQVDNLFVKLQEKENALETFRTTHNIASIAIQKETLFAQISRVKSEIAEINSQIAASKAHNDSLEQGLQSRSREVELGRVAGKKSSTSDTIEARLFDFRIKEADLSARYPDNHRELMEVREQIRLAESALSSEKQSDEVRTGIDPTYQAMQLALETGRAQLQAQIARRKKLEEGLKTPKTELAALIKNEPTEARMNRDVSLLEEEYLRYRQDVQRTNISRALDLGKISNLSIIQPPTMPLKPIKPKKALNLGLGFFLALFGGITLAFFLEYHDDSLKTNEDVAKHLGLPVLASVPFEESRLCM